MLKDLNKQIEAIKELYREIRKRKQKVEPIIVGQFALTVYTQGLYPSNVISLLYPDIQFLVNILKDLGYERTGNIFSKEDVVFEISNKFELITGKFNQIEVDGEIINVISLEDLLIDMMNECIRGDEQVCEVIKVLIKSYRQVIDFHYIFMNTKDKKAIIKFKEFRSK